MAHLLGIDGVGLVRGSRAILGDINLSLADGDRIGMVGPNGSGKTSLLRIIAGQVEPTSGRVTVRGSERTTTLEQVDRLHGTVLETLHPGLAEYEWASDRHIRELHAGLLADIPLDTPVDTLSGGQRRRVALAATLCQDASIVLLDEPTNHLDVDGVAFLADYLNRRFANGTGALVVVTHDRWFLDAVCTHMWDVVPGEPAHVETYEGGYAAYILARAERERIAQQAAQKRSNLLRKELAWLRRGAPARTSKPKFRLDAAAALISDVPAPRNTVELMKWATARLGKRVVNLEDATIGYPTRTVLRDVTLKLAPGERIGILGANGAGKSTLLKTIVGEIEPLAGKMERGKTLAPAILSQSTHELDEVEGMRVAEAVGRETIEMGDGEISAGQLVERLGFRGSRAWTRVAELSGGERRRLQFIRVLLGEPNLLVLDEPTNDLDVDTLAAMEDLLDGWPGTLLVVSHDRYFLERVTDRQIAVINGTVRDLPGGVDEFLRLSAAAHKDDDAVPGANGARSNGASSQQAAGAAPKDAARERELTKAMAARERMMEARRTKLAPIHEKMAACAESGDYEKLLELTSDADALQAEIDALEEEWLELSEELDAL